MGQATALHFQLECRNKSIPAEPKSFYLKRTIFKFFLSNFSGFFFPSRSCCSRVQKSLPAHKEKKFVKENLFIRIHGQTMGQRNVVMDNLLVCVLDRTFRFMKTVIQETDMGVQSVSFAVLQVIFALTNFCGFFNDLRKLDHVEISYENNQTNKQTKTTENLLNFRLLNVNKILQTT